MTALEQSELLRMAQAVALGELADQLFAEVCRQRRICEEFALRAPLTMMAATAGGIPRSIH